MVRTGVALFLALTSLAAALTWWIVPSHGQHRSDESIVVDRIRSFDGAGQAYRLTYTIDVPPKLFWAFKTDFGAAFLLTNRYILSHRLVSRRNNVFVTETRYRDTPDLVFRWQTTIFPSAHRMNYLLLNPEECGQKFNRGTIQLSSDSGRTKVVHSSYFDFFGATFWAYFPGPGGMVGFLRYTAQWERELIKQLLHRYQD